MQGIHLRDEDGDLSGGEFERKQKNKVRTPQ